MITLPVLHVNELYISCFLLVTVFTVTNGMLFSSVLDFAAKSCLPKNKPENICLFAMLIKRKEPASVQTRRRLSYMARNIFVWPQYDSNVCWKQWRSIKYSFEMWKFLIQPTFKKYIKLYFRGKKMRFQSYSSLPSIMFNF